MDGILRAGRARDQHKSAKHGQVCFVSSHSNLLKTPSYKTQEHACAFMCRISTNTNPCWNEDDDCGAEVPFLAREHL